MTRVFGRVDIGMTGSCGAGTRREEHRAELGMIVRRSVYEQRTAMSQSGMAFASPPSRAGCAACACRAVVVTPLSESAGLDRRLCETQIVRTTWRSEREEDLVHPEQQVVASGARVPSGTIRSVGQSMSDS